MAGNRRKFTASFKAHVVKQALREDVSLTELACTHGVHVSVITRWKQEALQSIEDGFSGKLERQHADTAAEINMLHAKIGKLTVERDFLVSASERLGLGGERLLYPLQKKK